MFLRTRQYPFSVLLKSIYENNVFLKACIIYIFFNKHLNAENYILTITSKQNVNNNKLKLSPIKYVYSAQYFQIILSCYV